MIPKYRAHIKPEFLHNGMPEGVLFPVSMISWEPNGNVWALTVLWEHPRAGLQGETFYKDQFELMASTKLLDKNGVEIFDGDICFDTLSCEKGVINFYCLSWQFDMTRFYPNCREGYTTDLSKRQINKLEVVGSVHANPELLK